MYLMFALVGYGNRRWDIANVLKGTTYFLREFYTGLGMGPTLSGPARLGTDNVGLCLARLGS